ncbi:MAG: RNA polymerase sigma factor [Gammaproteobacteria bacterium]|nr:RNA polymerase sigma factor [Gammaproteobacteria bacterium]
MSSTPDERRIRETSFIADAQNGNRSAFEKLVGECAPRIRAVLRRMIGHPDDVADVLQDTLVKAWESLQAFRGEARFATWLQTIAMRQAIDFLRGEKRYRAGALIYAQQECERTGAAAEVMSIVASPDFTFDVNEHIACCFSCVSRSLPPELQAALVLREVYELTNDEAAKQLGITRSVLRHRVSEARTTMMDRYDRLCALVGKQGVCYQCEALRQGASPQRRGPEPRGVLGAQSAPREEKWQQRMTIVRQAPLGEGVSTRLHDKILRSVDDVEAGVETDVSVDDIPTSTSCGPGSSSPDGQKNE